MFAEDFGRLELRFWTVMRDFEVFELREGFSEILAVDPAARYVFGN